MLTTHAKKRSQQRAIPEAMLHVLSVYGDEAAQKGGTVLLRLSRRSLKAVRKDLKSVLAHLDSLGDSYAVENEGGVVITIGHKY